MTEHERMVEAIKRKITRHGETGSLKISAKYNRYGRQCFRAGNAGNGRYFGSLETALLALANDEYVEGSILPKEKP